METLIGELTSVEARKALAESIIDLFDQWGLHLINQAELLGVKSMSAFIKGEPLPDNAIVLERAGHLLAIERALKKLYPFELGLRDTWIETSNAHLENEMPLKIMLDEGLDGIIKVRRLLARISHRDRSEDV